MTTLRSQRTRTMLTKVPQVTVLFWLVKMLSTTVGETGADFLSSTLGLGLSTTTVVAAVLLAGILMLQMRARQYVPALYWSVVVLVSVVGTLFADNLVDNLGVPLWVTTVVFAVLLATTFVLWFASERTLSIHTIVTSRREAFYWAAILFTFALGTAAGDLVSEGLDLGYVRAALLFASAIGIVAIGHYALGLGPVVAFWAAYVLTRPLGASLGDLVSQPTSDGGLGLGTTATSAVFLAVIVGVVVLFTRQAGRRLAAGALPGA